MRDNDEAISGEDQASACIEGYVTKVVICTSLVGTVQCKKQKLGEV